MVLGVGFVIQDKLTNQNLHQGPTRQGLYPIQPYYDSSPQAYISSSSSQASSSATLWHHKLGHPNATLLQHLVEQFHLPVHKPYHVTCTSCNVAKSHKLPFTLSDYCAANPFELMHMDVRGPAPVPSFRGFRYYLVILDDFTRYLWLYPMHYKSDVKTIVTQFSAFVKTQFHVDIKSFRSDNGGEFINQYLSHLFLEYGLIHQMSCPHTPEQNGRAERAHRHLMETTLTLLHQAGMPVQFWLEALLTSVYLINRLPHSAVKFQIPYTLLYHSALDYSLLRPFGCLHFPWLKPYTTHKLSPKFHPLCILILLWQMLTLSLCLFPFLLFLVATTIPVIPSADNSSTVPPVSLPSSSTTSVPSSVPVTAFSCSPSYGHQIQAWYF